MRKSRRPRPFGGRAHLLICQILTIIDPLKHCYCRNTTDHDPRGDHLMTAITKDLEDQAFCNLIIIPTSPLKAIMLPQAQKIKDARAQLQAAVDKDEAIMYALGLGV